MQMFVVVPVAARPNVNVGPGVVFPLLLGREVAMRVRNRRQLADDESEQHESGNTATEHWKYLAGLHLEAYAMFDQETTRLYHYSRLLDCGTHQSYGLCHLHDATDESCHAVGSLSSRALPRNPRRLEAPSSHRDKCSGHAG